METSIRNTRVARCDQQRRMALALKNRPRSREKRQVDCGEERSTEEHQIITWALAEDTKFLRPTELHSWDLIRYADEQVRVERRSVSTGSASLGNTFRSSRCRRASIGSRITSGQRSAKA